MPNKSQPNFEKIGREPEKEIQRRREARKQSALERLGAANPRCVICSEHDPRVLELHHLSGKQFGEEKVAVCRNCHRKLSDLQKDHPQKLAEIPDELERAAHFLSGLADFFEFLTGKLREFAGKLATRADDPHFHQEPTE